MAWFWQHGIGKSIRALLGSSVASCSSSQQTSVSQSVNFLRTDDTLCRLCRRHRSLSKPPRLLSERRGFDTPICDLASVIFWKLIICQKEKVVHLVAAEVCSCLRKTIHLQSNLLYLWRIWWFVLVCEMQWSAKLLNRNKSLRGQSIDTVHCFLLVCIANEGRPKFQVLEVCQVIAAVYGI